MFTYSSFDMSDLEVGDVIHFEYKFSYNMKSLIVNISHADNMRDYTLTLTGGATAIYSEMDLTTIIKSNAYRIRKPLAGLELI